jgi:hypothetical protein
MTRGVLKLSLSLTESPVAPVNAEFCKRCIDPTDASWLPLELGRNTVLGPEEKYKFGF